MSTMNWIAVHEDVLGGKLRGFRKAIGCSEAEALGILTLVWLWARKNAIFTGLLLNVERDDIVRFITPSISDQLDAKKVVEALIDTAWIDEEDDGLYVHDWSEWQQYWYKHLEKKEKDRNRKRLERGKNHINSDNDKEPSPPPTDAKDEEQAVKPKKESSKKKKKSEVPKVKYAENVSMQQSEYDTLVEKYGAQFTQKLIETLDNYKGSSGKTYKSDYRAILMWVVDKCEMKYRHLITHKQDVPASGNPFENYK